MKFVVLGLHFNGMWGMDSYALIKGNLERALGSNTISWMRTICDNTWQSVPRLFWFCEWRFKGLWAGYRALKVRTLHLQQKAESLAFCGQGGAQNCSEGFSTLCSGPTRRAGTERLETPGIHSSAGPGSEDRGQGLPTDTLCICFGVSF